MEDPEPAVPCSSPSCLLLAPPQLPGEARGGPRRLRWAAVLAGGAWGVPGAGAGGMQRRLEAQGSRALVPCPAPSLARPAVTFRSTTFKAGQEAADEDDEGVVEGEDGAPAAGRAGPVGWLFLACAALSVASTFIGEHSGRSGRDPRGPASAPKQRAAAAGLPAGLPARASAPPCSAPACRSLGRRRRAAALLHDRGRDWAPGERARAPTPAPRLRARRPCAGWVPLQRACRGTRPMPPRGPSHRLSRTHPG